MSDGHFNRCLLPHDPFSDGLRAGKAQMRMKALEAFRQHLDNEHPDWDETAKMQAVEDFRKAISF
jgi:hypothetical protein